MIDPNTATVGVGLGLPGYTPGAADRDLLQKAVRNSETELIEDAMLNDKIKLSDFERTEEELNEQVCALKILELHSQQELLQLHYLSQVLAASFNFKVTVKVKKTGKLQKQNFQFCKSNQSFQ